MRLQVGYSPEAQMHDLPLLVNITVALGYALVGGLVARRLGLPTIVGYLLAGVALGPFTPGFRGDQAAIQQMAEFGVILLMFGVGLHFNMSDLWHVRRIVVPGAVLQMAAVAWVGSLLGSAWGFSSAGAWILGIAASVASTVVMLRALMDRGWLDTPHGKVAIGWLVLEDLLTVAILVLLPVLAGPSPAGPWVTAGWAVGKAALFIALMAFAGARIVPAILGRVVHTRSRELFILVALTMAAGTALVSSAFFGVSLALGAFAAGLVVSESPFSHQIYADLLPFREAFAVIFFVSVGMLVEPGYVLAHWDRLLLFSLLITLGKGLLSGALSWALGCAGRTSLVLTTGRAQIGEFSFIIGQTGVALGALDHSQYSLILAGAIVSITVNPLLMALVEPAERALKRRDLWRLLDRGPADLPPPDAGLAGHVVIVGCGRVGRHLAETLARLEIPRLVIESDPIRIEKLRELGVPVLYGEAGNSEILSQAALPAARALVITLPDEATSLTVVAAAKKIAPELHIISRASTWEAARRLLADGAGEVVRPELEGGVEIVRRTLLELKLPAREIQRYTDTIRREGMDESERVSLERSRVLHDIITAVRDLEIGWIVVDDHSPLAGKRIVDASLRQATGVSVVAISRTGALISNPGPEVIFVPGDRVAVIGEPDQVALAEAIFRAPEDSPGTP
jgi:CPA2 family monovalent cation:H+ antiporter-2